MVAIRGYSKVLGFSHLLSTRAICFAIERQEIERNDDVHRAHELKNSQKYSIILMRLSDA